VAEVTLDDVRAAAARIAPFVVRTPLERSLELSQRYGVDVWLKFECFQLTGSFKLRGALNALQLLRAPTAVVTASAGNHGLGVARAAAVLGVQSTVVVPKTASQAKVDALRGSGAELIQVGDRYDEAEAAAIRLAHTLAQPFISAYNDPNVIAGGGTVALEILQDRPEIRELIVPVGGGGLTSGIAVAADGLDPEVRVYGVQSEASPALHAALEAGRLVPVAVGPSLADGLAGNIEAGSITFDLLARYVRRVALVSEQAIADAMHWLLVHERAVVEGSAAVGVAALLSGQHVPRGPTALVLTGRNVARSVLQEYAHAPVRIPSL
jgi:threonine dehydratase